MHPRGGLLIIWVGFLFGHARCWGGAPKWPTYQVSEWYCTDQIKYCCVSRVEELLSPLSDSKECLDAIPDKADKEVIHEPLLAVQIKNTWAWADMGAYIDCCSMPDSQATCSRRLKRHRGGWIAGAWGRTDELVGASVTIKNQKGGFRIYDCESDVVQQYMKAEDIMPLSNAEWRKGDFEKFKQLSKNWD